MAYECGSGGGAYACIPLEIQRSKQVKRHVKFRCPFCLRKLEPRNGQRMCKCGYWINPVSNDEWKEADEQSDLLDITKLDHICQNSWTELRHVKEVK